MNAGGYRVSPLEVEAALDDCPGVAEVAVTEYRGDARTLTIIAAFVVRRDGSAIDADAVLAHAGAAARRLQAPEAGRSSSPHCREAPTASCSGGRFGPSSRRPAMHEVLTGLRIVEAASFIAAPSCGLHLAQLGAEVIRIDPIGGGPDLHRWPRDAGGRKPLLGRAEQGQEIDRDRPFPSRRDARWRSGWPRRPATMPASSSPISRPTVSSPMGSSRRSVPTSSCSESWAGATAPRRSTTPSMRRWASR